MRMDLWLPQGRRRQGLWLVFRRRMKQGRRPEVFVRMRCRSPGCGHNREEMNAADGAQFVDGLIEFLAGDF